MVTSRSWRTGLAGQAGRPATSVAMPPPRHSDSVKRLCLVSLVVLAAVTAGCGPDKAPEVLEHRVLPRDVGGAQLTPSRLADIYGTTVFVYAVRDAAGGEVAVVDDTGAPAGAALDDRRLVIYAEGSGDSFKEFRYTARLIAESPHAFSPGSSGAVLLLPVHWSASGDVVREHVNIEAQRRGAVALQDMVHAHAARHGGAPGAFVSLLGFSAGSRVVQMAFGAQLTGKAAEAVEGDCPPYMNTVRDIVFVGSSLSRHDPVPLAGIRGRFINFVNRRDTHFGDRAPNVTPAGSGPRLGKLVNPVTAVQRSPGFGASANGFDRLPTLTSPEQFTVVDASPAGREAFRRVNVPVPAKLLPYNIVGTPVENDDLDDFLNQAHNHFILVGRGPAGATSGAEFAQYRDVAAEFVRKFVAPALVLGRVAAAELTAQAKPVTAFDVLTSPLKVPGKMIEPLLKPDSTKKAPRKSQPDEEAPVDPPADDPPNENPPRQ